MITLNRQFVLSGGTGPYTYTWTTNSLCASVSPRQGTTSSVVDASFTFSDEACLQASTFSLTATDVNGCATTFSHSPTNPCLDFSVTPPSQGTGYSFSLSGSTPTCTETNFVWEYDTTLFSSAQLFENDFASTITLTPSTSVTNWPNTSTLRVTATDCHGCSLEQTLQFNICKPVPQPATVELSCMGNQFTSTTFSLPAPTGCPDAVINWSTIQFQANPEFTFTNVSPNVFYVTAPITTTPGLFSAFYTVRTTQGIQTQTGSINIIVNSCADTPIVIPNFTTQIECTQQVDDYLLIDVEDRVLTTETVDWSSFALVTPPSPLSNDITLITQINGRHYIQYRIPLLSGSDTFRWTVCTTLGNCAQAASYTIILECPTDPLATDDDACVECGMSQVIDVLDNDLSGGAPFLLSSIAIVTPPTLGTVAIPGNGTIIYSAFSNSTGTDIFSYTVTNAGGAVSNAAIVTVDVVCAGGDGTALVCNT